MAETSSSVLSAAPGENKAGKARVRAALRLFSAVLFAIIGAFIGLAALLFAAPEHTLLWVGGSALLGLLLGFFGAAILVAAPARWYAAQLRRHIGHEAIAGLAGALGGLLAGALLTPALSNLPGPWGVYLPILASVCLAAIAATTGYIWAQSQTFTASLPTITASGRDGRGPNRAPSSRILVDTSAVIDGRIADIGEAGFLPGPLLVPRFVLDELRHIADSPDTLRRNRGRRGLEILNRLRREAVVSVEVIDVDAKDIRDVDGKLVQIAAELGCAIVTTDFNLNRVAELQGIQVLNVNDLANSLRPVVLPGEQMTVSIIQEGKEHNQGVAFLDDGTMVVIENGRYCIGTEQPVIVNRVLQTAAGRLIFAHLREG